MPEVNWTHKGLQPIINAIPNTMNKYIDVGCGRGIIGAMVKIYKDASYTCGIDGFNDYVEFCKKSRFYDEVKQIKFTDGLLPFENNEFDCATNIEVIEHLDKNSGMILIQELQRISTRVIISTPGNFYQQDEFDGNELQRHRSKWKSEDFKKQGFKVYGFGDFMFNGKAIKYFSTAFSGLVKKFPSNAEFLLCIK